MKQMSNKKANIAISENNKLIVTQNSLKNCKRRLHMEFPEVPLYGSIKRPPVLRSDISESLVRRI